MYNTFINGVQHVWLGISIFLLLILSFSRTTIFKNALTERHFDRRRLVLFTVLFSAMAVSGTYWSVSAGGGIINFRAVGIMLAGFIGGPAVGSITGLIAGLHRAFFINTDASYIHGGLSILQGIAAGFTTNYLKSKHHRLWLWALIYAFLLEVLFWAFFALLTWPETVANPNALALLSLPILITNTIAVSLFIGVLEVSTYIWDSEKTKTTKNTFDAIQMIFSTLQAGFKDLTVTKITEIITTALPSLIWTAVIYKSRVYIRGAYKTKEDRTVVLATPPPVIGQAAVVQLTEKKVIIKAGKKSATTVIKIYPKQMILKKQNVTLSCTPQWKEGGISKLTILLKRK